LPTEPPNPAALALITAPLRPKLASSFLGHRRSSRTPITSRSPQDHRKSSSVCNIERRVAIHENPIRIPVRYPSLNPTVHEPRRLGRMHEGWVKDFQLGEESGTKNRVRSQPGRHWAATSQRVFDLAQSERIQRLWGFDTDLRANSVFRPPTNIVDGLCSGGRPPRRGCSLESAWPIGATTVAN
jgi:hypothetical protein